MTTIVRPVGRQLQRLRSNTGLEKYTVSGPVESSIVHLPGVSVLIWTFAYADIVEVEVRDHMLRVTMGQRNMTESEALTYLNSIPVGIPQDDVQIFEQNH